MNSLLICRKKSKSWSLFAMIAAFSSIFCVPAFANSGSTATIDDMLGIFSKLFAWILKEGAILLNWMLDKPILMIAMGLFFCGAIIAFLMRIYHSV